MIILKKLHYTIFASIFLLSFCFVVLYGDYILFFQEQQFLLFFSSDYIQYYFNKPADIIEFLGKLAMQFYQNIYLGSVIISIVITIPATIFYLINKRMRFNNSLSFIYLITPSCLLLLGQVHYQHILTYHLGFIVILSFFLLFLYQKNNLYRFIASLIILPATFFIAGGFIWVLQLMFIMYFIAYENGKTRYLYPIITTILAVSIVYVSKTVIFLQPYDQLIYYPLPIINNKFHRILMYLLTFVLMSYPLVSRISQKNILKNREPNHLSLGLISVTIIITTGLLSLFYDSNVANVLRLNKKIDNEEWQEAIEFQEESHSRNMLGQYYYNLALSETDQLCDRLFHGKQDFGGHSILLPWDNENLEWGGYFYYSIGLINATHRWAYESMVVNGYNPQNLRFLAKTNIINGNYRVARKYVNMLKNTLFYREIALEYETLLDDPDLILQHPEFKNKLELLPGNDFFIEIDSPQRNMALLYQANPGNRKVFEYMNAWYLLEKHVVEVIDHAPEMKSLNYSRIPKHIEEAILVYYDATGDFPDIGGLEVSNETQLRFSQYKSLYTNISRSSPDLLEERMKESFGNTFWYYFHFN